MKKFNLENIDKKHPFKVPDAYFDGLGERIHQRISNNSLGDSAENNLESNLLKNIDKKMPFGTPEGYFEDFSARLDERIKLQNNHQTSKQEIKIYTPKPFYAKWSVYAKKMAIAAAVVLVGGFAYVIYDNNQQDNQQNNIENFLAFNDVPKDISNNEIVEYFKEHHTDNNENYVLEHITETHITETHLEELGSTKEISKDILKEIPKESSQENTKEKSSENKDKNKILNDLPKEELQEMLNNGELEEEEVLDQNNNNK